MKSAVIGLGKVRLGLMTQNSPSGRFCLGKQWRNEDMKVEVPLSCRRSR